uniref:Protein kinase domain-containing protein n=1 Tax=Schistocephalus solidus TaxID=70667 RepID=A0A183SIM9_SCHSO
LLRVNPESHFRDLLRQPSTRLLSGQSVRVKRDESRRLTRPVTASMPRRRPLLDPLDSGQPANELRQLNPHSTHLLTCLGIVSPRPLGLVLPLAPRGNLSDWMNSMRLIYDERCALAQSSGERSQLFPIHPLTLTCLIHQVALALSYLHGMRIVYRDLKPDNIFVWRMPEPVGADLYCPSTANAVPAQALRRFSTLTRTTGTNVLSTLNALSSHPCSVSVVLGDYGVSRARANLDGCRGYVGTPGYMAPEILEHFGEETYTAKRFIEPKFTGASSLASVAADRIFIHSGVRSHRSIDLSKQTSFVWVMNRQSSDLVEIGLALSLGVDIYSFGILMASIVNMQAPFHGFTNLRFQLTQHILSGGRPVIPIETQRQCPLVYLDLMTRCWSSDPSQRPAADEIVTLTSLPDYSSRQSSALRRTASGRSNDLPAQPSPSSLWNYRPFSSLASTPASSPLSGIFIDRGFARLRSVTRVDCLKTITCATIDCLGRLWLGGQCSLPSSPSSINKDSSPSKLSSPLSSVSDCSPGGLCSAYDSTCLGRLILIESPVWLGCESTSQGRLTAPTGRIAAATASATGTSEARSGDATARLACVWSVFTSPGGGFPAAVGSLPSAGESLPLSLTGPSAFPTALCHSPDFTVPGGPGVLWCADSCGRLFAICCSTLTLLAAVTFFEERLRALQPPRETAATCFADDCIVLFPIHYPPHFAPHVAAASLRPVASVVLGLATGWLGTACLSQSVRDDPSVLPAHSLRIDWTENLLRRQCRLYLCGAEVGKGLCWLAGTGSCIAAYTTSFTFGGDSEVMVDSQPALRLQLDSSWNPRKSSASSSGSGTQHAKCGRLCGLQTSAVTSIAVDTSDYGSHPEGMQAAEAFSINKCNDLSNPYLLLTLSLAKALSHSGFSRPSSPPSFPSHLSLAHEVTCWSVSSRSPLRSISLFGLISPRQPARAPVEHSSMASRGSTMGGFVQRLCWIQEVGLLAGTSRGALLKITWPSFPVDASITCTHLRLHRGPADPCFVLIGSVPNAVDAPSVGPVGGYIGQRCLLTVGRGFLHPLRAVVSSYQSEMTELEGNVMGEDVPTSSLSSHFFITGLFSDEFFDRPIA